MKTLISFVIMTYSIVLGSGAAMAGNVFITGVKIIGGGTFAPSHNVTLSFNSNGTAYSAKSKHLLGTRRFGTGSEYQKIYYIDSPVGASVTSTSTPTFDFSNWRSL